AYRLVELERWRSFSGLPLNIHPKFFPADDRLAARCVIAVQRREGAARALALAGALLQSVWAEEGNIADESHLRELMQGLGLSVDEVLADAVSDTVHALYEENTQEALEAKVFGAPWYVFEGIPYWGQDRLDFLERAFAASESRAA
ncbi:MAG: 2-hydroxychromene-2-carboxylate isomerase, partial [Betaproteobacteria bacterium]|nr:2-hydroxychromene-2-carboxylate isomerase [Betaproteobacteria bacterium]